MSMRSYNAGSSIQMGNLMVSPGSTSTEAREPSACCSMASWPTCRPSYALRLREAWGESDGLPPFSGPIEADETHIGGKRKNKSNPERKAATGRGGVDMETVVGVNDRETNKVAARHVVATDIPPVAGFVAEKAKIEAKVYWDEAAVYNALDSWFDHESVDHSASEYVRGDAHTNGIESLWSMFKRGYHGTYHKMPPKHLNRYVAEFRGRHNVRKADTAEQMAQLVAASVGKPLMYGDLIADNGLDSGARS